VSVLHEEHFYILSEMGFQFRHDTGLTVDNWVSLLIGKVSAIRSDTIVPEGVIEKVERSGFLLTHAVVEDFEGDFYIKAFNHQQLCGFLPFPVHENALRFVAINRHTGALSIFADSVWPILTLSLFEEFGTWSALLSAMTEAEQAIEAGDLALSLSQKDQLALTRYNSLVDKVVYLLGEKKCPLHIYSALMTLFPNARPGTPFFDASINSLKRSLSSRSDICIDGYNDYVVVLGHEKLKQWGVA
jgi:hypothetical protein